MKLRHRAALGMAAFLQFFLVSAAYSACGKKVLCSLSGNNGGTYYFSVPDDFEHSKAKKAFLFFHGHNGSGRGVIGNKGLVRQLHEAGYVVIAPDGPLFTFNGRSARGWAARPEGTSPRGKRNDIAFVERVLGDVARKTGIAPGDTVVSGFSSGGSMAWYFSCYSKMKLAGVIAVAGGLRRPLPDGGVPQLDGSIAKKCPAGPRRVIHIHGFSDRQVPLEGRGIRAWHQGDVFEGLAVQRHSNQCQSRPDKMKITSNYWCRDWLKCKSKKTIRLCLHAGGHGMPKGWLDLGLDWLKPSASRQSGD